MNNLNERSGYGSDNDTVSTHTTFASTIKDENENQDDITVISDVKKLTKSIKSKRDNDCYKVFVEKKVKINRKGKKPIYKWKKAPIYFYETNSNPGSVIRDAITGHYYTGYHTGKRLDEALFYSTAYCIGDACKPGQKIGDNRDAQFLYFANPESFERLFKRTLTAERKQRWLEEYQEAKQMDKERQRENKTANKVYTIIK